MRITPSQLRKAGFQVLSTGIAIKRRLCRQKSVVTTVRLTPRVKGGRTYDASAFERGIAYKVEPNFNFSSVATMPEVRDWCHFAFC